MSDMSNTITGAQAAQPVPETLTTTESFWAKLYGWAAGLWHKGKALAVDAEAYTESHPDIVAGAKALEAMAPPQLRQGISVAQELVTAIEGIDLHAAATGLPMTATKP